MRVEEVRFQRSTLGAVVHCMACAVLDCPAGMVGLYGTNAGHRQTIEATSLGLAIVSTDTMV